MENSEKITNNLLTLKFCDDFEIICQGMRENCILYLRILNIMRESDSTPAAWLDKNVLLFPVPHIIPEYFTGIFSQPHGLRCTCVSWSNGCTCPLSSGRWSHQCCVSIAWSWPPAPPCIGWRPRRSPWIWIFPVRGSGRIHGFAHFPVHAPVQDNDTGYIVWFIVHLDKRNGIKNDIFQP